MEIVNDKGLLDKYIAERGITAYFGSCSPAFSLLHYYPGKFLATPFLPGQYIHFLAEGELMLYNMPDEETTFFIRSTQADMGVLGELELIDTRFISLFVEATTEVYTVAVYINRYREQLLNDATFLRLLCNSLALKLKGVTEASLSIPLNKKLAMYLATMDSDKPIRDIAKLAANFNVSSRQLIRVLKGFCREGYLEHKGKGLYCILKVPPVT